MNDKRKQARTLYLLWAVYFAFNGFYALPVYGTMQDRAQHPEKFTRLHDFLVGPLALLPLVIPLILLGLGLLLWKSLLTGKINLDYEKRGRPTFGMSAKPTSRLQTAFVTMMAVFEANTMIGLVFFFLGAPPIKFVTFAVGTCCLLLVALQKLIAALAR